MTVTVFWVIFVLLTITVLANRLRVFGRFPKIAKAVGTFVTTTYL